MYFANSCLGIAVSVCLILNKNQDLGYQASDCAPNRITVGDNHYFSTPGYLVLPLNQIIPLYEVQVDGSKVKVADINIVNTGTYILEGEVFTSGSYVIAQSPNKKTPQLPNFANLN
jgi:hypothetical protein